MNLLVNKRFIQIFIIIIAIIGINQSFAKENCHNTINILAQKSRKIKLVSVGKNKLIKDYDYIVDIDGLTVRKQCSSACYHEASTNMAEIFLRSHIPSIKEFRMSIFHNYMDLYLYKLKQKIGINPIEITNFGYLDSSLDALKESGMKFYKDQIDDYKEVEKSFEQLEKFIEKNKTSNEIVTLVKAEAQKMILKYEQKFGRPEYTISPEKISSLYSDKYKILKENVTTNNMGAYQNIKAEDKRLGVERLHITTIKEQIVESLKKGNPVGLGMRMNADKEDPIYKISGIRRFFSGLGGGHAVTIVGVKLDKNKQVESFLILDTAGTMTRDQGFIHMLPSYFDKALENIYLIND